MFVNKIELLKGSRAGIRASSCQQDRKEPIKAEQRIPLHKDNYVLKVRCQAWLKLTKSYRSCL